MATVLRQKFLRMPSGYVRLATKHSCDLGNFAFLIQVSNPGSRPFVLNRLVDHIVVLPPGCDLVEVSPPYDQSGNTATLGANILYEMLCSHASRFIK